MHGQPRVDYLSALWTLTEERSAPHPPPPCQTPASVDAICGQGVSSLSAGRGMSLATTEAGDRGQHGLAWRGVAWLGLAWLRRGWPRGRELVGSLPLPFCSGGWKLCSVSRALCQLRSLPSDIKDPLGGLEGHGLPSFPPSSPLGGALNTAGPGGEVAIWGENTALSNLGLMGTQKNKRVCGRWSRDAAMSKLPPPNPKKVD